MEKTGSKLTKFSDLPDLELINMALEQNQMAFVTLYSRYNGGVRNHISRYINQKEDVEDICLESFQKAFSQLATYNSKYKFSTWLYRIARNTAFDHLSKHDRERTNMPTTSLSDDYGELASLQAPIQNPEESIINQQEYDKWLMNIERLKPDYKAVAKMNLIEHYGYREIAEELNIPLNTVKTRIRRAKEQLMKMMDISDELL